MCLREFLFRPSVDHEHIVGPNEGRVGQKVHNDDRILALGDPSSLSGFEIRGWLSCYGHLVVNREHAADKKAVNDHDDHVVLRLSRERKGVDGANTLGLRVVVGQRRVGE